MFTSYGSRILLLSAFTAANLSCAVQAEGPVAFTPDSVFEGSSLAGWQPLNNSGWRAANGQIEAISSGWLVSERELQDTGFFASFKCPSTCEAGILLRARQTENGWSGIYVSLAGDDLASYRVTLDETGRETSRELLRPIRGQVRLAPPPSENRGRPNDPPPLSANDWNTIQIILDADIVRPVLNGESLPSSATDDLESGFGSVAIRATAGTQFRDIGIADLALRSWPEEQVSDNFRMQQLTDMYYTWSGTAADINMDGVNDIVSGPFVFFGPDFTSHREIYLGSSLSPSNDYPMQSMMQFAHDFTGDGWPDVLEVGGVRTPATLRVNPQGEARRWDSFEVVPVVRKEIAVTADMDADGEPEFIYTDGNGLRIAEPDPANPTGVWNVTVVSGEALPGHGLGVGDINGDGRMDIVEASTWWEQPAGDDDWIRHDYSFGNGGEIGIYDVNGDGLNDVVTSLEAHGFGLAWHQQIRSASGEINFAQHTFLEGPNGQNVGGVVFSEPHGTAFADIDGDGVKDFFVGKRFWAHKDSYTDPDPHGPPVLYVYRAIRNSSAPGGAEFVPELIHNRSGAGNTLFAEDINNDGTVDVLTATDRGTFVFWGLKSR